MNTTGTVLASQVTNDARGMYYAATEKDGSIVAISAATADLLSRFDIPVLRIIEDPKPPKPATPRERWNLAIKALRKSGVAVQQNIGGCCNSCSEPFKGVKSFDPESTPAAWFIFAQDQGIKWHKDGLAVVPKQYTVLEQAKPVFFNHANGSAARIVEAFEAQGFDVEWDGNDATSVKVTVPARRKSPWE